MQVMTLRDEVEQLLDEHASEPLADYLTGCLNAYEPDSWQQAVAIRKEWDRRADGLARLVEDIRPYIILST